MPKKSRISLDADEVALLWSPRKGYRLLVPDKAPEDEMTMEEQFMGAILVKSGDPDFVDRVVRAFFDQTRH